MQHLPIIQIDNVLIPLDIITERFCCDLDACKGICCVEGDAGAPVTLDEIRGIEDSLDIIWSELSASAQAVVGKDCVFTCYDNGCCLCALEKAYRSGKAKFCKPISCALYPIREKTLRSGDIALHYHRWAVCADARRKGQELNLPVYKFLQGPLTRRFGEDWYAALETAVEELKSQGMIE